MCRGVTDTRSQESGAALWPRSRLVHERRMSSFPLKSHIHPGRFLPPGLPLCPDGEKGTLCFPPSPHAPFARGHQTQAAAPPFSVGSTVPAVERRGRESRRESEQPKDEGEDEKCLPWAGGEHTRVQLSETKQHTHVRASPRIPVSRRPAVEQL